MLTDYYKLEALLQWNNYNWYSRKSMQPKSSIQSLCTILYSIFIRNKKVNWVPFGTSYGSNKKPKVSVL